MKYIDNELLIVCPKCGEPDQEQLIEHEDKLYCENCWHDWASGNDTCVGCGDWVAGSRYTYCGECQQGQYEDYVIDRARGK